MLRIGEIVTGDENFLMNISKNYVDIVNKLSVYKFISDENKFLACLVLSQTEKQYKKYLIKSLVNLKKLPVKNLIEDWQQSKLEINDIDLRYCLSDQELDLLSSLDIESHLEEYEDKYPDLFEDIFDTNFYPTKKKGMLYIRRLAQYHVEKINNYSDFQKLVLFFVMAQLLVNWEPSCIHLGKMLLEDWNTKDIYNWFSYIWPIYYSNK